MVEFLRLFVMATPARWACLGCSWGAINAVIVGILALICALSHLGKVWSGIQRRVVGFRNLVGKNWGLHRMSRQPTFEVDEAV